MNDTFQPPRNALTASTVERARLEVRGVAMPQIRKNLDR
jgi:hypothetical protein